jgi:hypothetical protein
MKTCGELLTGACTVNRDDSLSLPPYEGRTTLKTRLPSPDPVQDLAPLAERPWTATHRDPNRGTGIDTTS